MIIATSPFYHRVSVEDREDLIKESVQMASQLLRNDSRSDFTFSYTALMAIAVRQPDTRADVSEPS